MAQVPYSSVPTETPTSGGTGASPVSVDTSPNSFGAQIGEADQRAGAQIQETSNKAFDLANHYAEQAAQAHADDIIANQLVPATTKISSDYYQTKGMAAHTAYQPTLDALQEAQSDAIKDLPPYQQNLIRSFSVRHITNLQDGMMRHMDQEQTQYEKQGVNDFINAQGSIAVAAGSDPNVVNQSIQAAVGRSNLYATSPTGGGIDPTDPQGKALLDENTRQVTGKIAQQVVSSAVSRGDIGFANSVYLQNKDSIDGPQQVEIEKNLHAENLKHTVASNVEAINNGSPLAPPINGGMPVVQVKAAVAANAQSRGADPNVALMISGLESSFGRTSDNVGQVKGLPPTIDSQTTKQIEATDAANKLFGGAATPAQIYTVYQQGVGGGVALLKPENANAKAVDVLSPFYSNPKDALSAIQQNGGNVTMTSKQFTDFLQQKCDSMYSQVKCNTVDANGNKIDLGKAILQPHQTGGITQQPAANPLQAYQNYDLAGALQQANAITNDDERKGTIDGIKAHVSQLKEVADQYKEQGTSNLRTVTSQPDFLSVNDPRITPDMRNFMNQDQSAYDSVYRQAERNRLAANGGAKGKTPLGDGFSYLQQEAYAGKLNATDMFYHLDNDLTQAGFDKLKGVVKPQVGSEPSDQDSMVSFLKYGHERIVHSSLFDNTPDAEKAYQGWYSDVSKAIDAKQKAGIPVSQLIDPNSKDYVGGNIGQFLIPVQKQLGDRAEKINAGLQGAQSLPQEKMRSPGETPEAYLARMQ